MKALPARLAPLAALAAYTLWLLSGLGGVPFHPDEASWIYMSRDFDAWLANPASLGYDPARVADPVQIHRLIDAPLTKLWIGAARRIAGLPATPADWDWSRSWDENVSGGALPEAGLLWVSRLAVALCLPLALICLYAAGRTLSGTGLGWLAAAFLAFNPLLLLHGRRAMNEGVLLLGVALFIFGLATAGGWRPLWLGLGAALSFGAKISSAALLPVGLLACLLPLAQKDWRAAARQTGIYLIVVIVLTVWFNPVFWSRPVEAARAALEQRQALMQRQVEDVAAQAPGQALERLDTRLLVLTANLYLLPPLPAEVGNYASQTAGAEQAYLADPLHDLLRGLPGGGLLLALTLLGVTIALYSVLRRGEEQTPDLGLLTLAALAQAAVLLTVRLPWQRYVIPLVPFVCLWAAYGGARLAELVKMLSQKQPPP